jgi:two-component system, cell cycle sensor histidine kinase and response regulator CckA
VIKQHFIESIITKPVSKILIIEDEWLTAHSLKVYLESNGYTISGLANDYTTAVESALATKPDLAIVDIHIKGEKDGIETAREIKSKFETPVIFLTGHADNETIQRAKKLEPLSFVIKPFDTQMLRSAIEIGLYKHNIDRKLKESGKLFSATLNSIIDCVITLNMDEQITYINTAGELLLRCHSKDIIGKKISSIISLKDEKKSKNILKEYTEYIKKRADSTLPYDYSFSEGILTLLHKPALQKSRNEHTSITSTEKREFNVEFNLTTLSNQVYKSGFVIVFRDISEKVKSKIKTQELENQLFQAQKMDAIGKLAGGIAHDFNNLLTAIMGNLTLMKEELSNPESKERLTVTEKACIRASELVSKLLTFSRKNNGSQLKLNIIPLIEEAISILSPGMKGVEITTQFEANTLKVKGDANEFHQIIMNLVLNAHDAIKEKLKNPNASSALFKNFAKDFFPAISIDVKLLSADETLEVIKEAASLVPTREFQKKTSQESLPSSYVVITVSDNGVGMKPELKNRIFEPFFTNKPFGSGTGLGLSVVYGIVKKYRGYLNVESEEHEGTSIKVYIPSASKSDYDAPSQDILEQEILTQPLSSQKENVYTVTDPVEQFGVLVADEDPLALDLTSSMIKQLNLKVYTSTKSSDVLSLCQDMTRNIKVLITKPRLSDISADELLEKVRAVNNKVRFIISGMQETTSSEKVSKSKSALQGAIEVIPEANSLSASLIVKQPVVREAYKVLKRPYRVQDLAVLIKEVMNE